MPHAGPLLSTEKLLVLYGCALVRVRGVASSLETLKKWQLPLLPPLHSARAAFGVLPSINREVLELIQTHMTQKPLLWVEAGAHAVRIRPECAGAVWAGAGVACVCVNREVVHLDLTLTSRQSWPGSGRVAENC
jgi:hypothetical protein